MKVSHPSHVFITLGDITNIHADALAVSCGWLFGSEAKGFGGLPRLAPRYRLAPTSSKGRGRFYQLTMMPASASLSWVRPRMAV